MVFAMCREVDVERGLETCFRIIDSPALEIEVAQIRVADRIVWVVRTQPRLTYAEGTSVESLRLIETVHSEADYPQVAQAFGDKEAIRTFGFLEKLAGFTV